VTEAYSGISSPELVAAEYLDTTASTVGIATPEFSGLFSGVTRALQCTSLQMLQRPSARGVIESVTYVCSKLAQCAYKANVGGSIPSPPTICFRSILLSGGHMVWSDRITFDAAVMGGKPCIRGIRVTVGTLVGLIAAGRTQDEILLAYPYLEPADIHAALVYAAWRSEERELPLATA